MIQDAKVGKERQRTSEWCWVASISMVFGYYGHPVSQETIAKAVQGSAANLPASGALVSSALNREWTDANGKKFRSRATYSDLQLGVMQVTNDDIVAELRANRPLIIGVMNPGGQGGHAMVLSAVTYRAIQNHMAVSEGTVRDPWPFNASPRTLTVTELRPIYMAKISVENVSDTAVARGTQPTSQSWGECRSACTSTRGACAANAQVAAGQCPTAAQKASAQACSCPRWPADNLGCYQVCQNYFSALSQCPRDDTDVCDERGKTCAERCDAANSSSGTTSTSSDRKSGSPSTRTPPAGPGKWETKDERFDASASAADGWEASDDDSAEARKFVRGSALYSLHEACGKLAQERFGSRPTEIAGFGVVERDTITVPISCARDEEKDEWSCRADPARIAGRCYAQHQVWVSGQ
jgi:hypothetical protein